MFELDRAKAEWMLEGLARRIRADYNAGSPIACANEPYR